MDEKAIGIILSKREWNRLTENQSKDNEDSFVFHLAKRGEELALEVLFFTIDGLLISELRGNAFIIKDQTVIVRGFVEIPSVIYNSTNFQRKKNTRIIFELAQKNGVTIINERNNIKKTHFLDLIASKPALKDFIKNNEEAIQPPLQFFVLGQKGYHQKWTIPLIYAKNNDVTYSFEEAIQLLEQNQLKQVSVKEKLYEVSKRILEMIHYYYPALYEIGLQFILKENGTVQIQTTCPVVTIINDLSNWDKKLAEAIICWPIELAKAIVDSKNNETTRPEKPIGTETSLPFSDELFDDAKIASFKGRAPYFEARIWVKFKVFQDNELTLMLPDRIASQLRNQPKAIKFGIIEEACQFVIYEDAILLRNNSFQHPVDLFVSHILAEKMHIPLDLVYQIQFTEGKAIIGPTIGLLLGEKNQIYNLDYMEKFKDRFGEFHRFGGVTIAFSTRSIDWDNRIAYGMVYDPKEKRWRYDSTPIPATIYRRNFHQNKENIKQLVNWTGNNLFNSYHFKKSDLYLLKNSPEIKHHLPATFLLKNLEELINFAVEKKKIIIKPVSLSRGRGIFILELNSEMEGYILYDYRNMTKIQHGFKDIAELQAFLEEIGILNQEYLFQTYIPLLKVKNRALDVRVVMQKFNKMKWSCSGIECRVAREYEELTNIARGGEAMTLEEVIKSSSQGLSYSNVYRNIVNLSQSFCQLMDQSNEHFAEFGLDIALDKDGYPWILEANIYPSFKGFKILNYETYLKIRHQPLFYAVQIQGFQILDDVSVWKPDSFHEIY